MSNMIFLSVGVGIVLAVTASAWGQLPAGGEPPALRADHFPDAMHAVVWRNWPVVPAERLAKVLGTTPQNVQAVAESMGLGPQKAVSAQWRTRGYITVLRRNWHLLPYDQLLTLLDMSAEQLAYNLREDDFLFQKLGSLKPKCPPVVYTPPTPAARQRAAEIRRIVSETFPEGLMGQEERFAFVDRLGGGTGILPVSRTGVPPVEADQSRAETVLRPTGETPVPPGGRLSPRFIYSYFALYGDPLTSPELDPYPDGLLRRLAAVGVDGVWMHVVLRTLAPSKTFPEFGQGHEKRLANLRDLVRRAGRHGIGVYLYMNEPRAMPAAFFEPPERAGFRGVREGDHYTLCTSAEPVRDWVRDSLAYVFAQVPDLAGVFTITGSENLTHCASHHQQASCPRCGKRAPAAVVAEINAAIAEGVRRGSPKARTIVWDWGWDDAWAADIIAALPKDCMLMSVSEWSKPITRGGVASTVGEYSMSVVGPGPRATRHWQLARQAGLKTVAKVQLNNTWELSAVPYLPVMDLVAQHVENLAAAGVDGMMLSWSLGGYPSPNLQVAERFNRKVLPDRQAVLDEVARERFGPDGAAAGRRAWTAFSKAFVEFPFHVSVLYQGPQHYGPANLLYAAPSGYKATMVGFPYDDVDGWRGPYPADVLAGQFDKLAAAWRSGLADLADAAAHAPPQCQPAAREELAFARAAALHFQTVANQTRFILARSALAAPAADRSALTEQMRKLLRDEAQIARDLFTLTSQDSRIGYEASNHYYYLPIDLAEKVLNCRHIEEHLPPAP
jgi:hypothetical protein